MPTRRGFLGSIGLPAAGALATTRLRAEALPRFEEAFADVDARGVPAHEAATDESLWFEVQQAFTVDRSLVNLNNGGVSAAPAVVQEAMKRHLDYSNTAPVVHHVADPGAAARGGARAPGARLRLRRRGDRDHAQRLREPADLPARLRPEAPATRS